MIGKAETNKREKKEKLLGAAYSLFMDRDIHDVSISDLTAKAGVAKGTFYLFFQDKYELRDQLIARESSKLLREALHQLDQNDIRNFEDAVVFMINQVLLQLQSNPLLLKIIQRNLSIGLFHSSLHQAVSSANDELSLFDQFEQHARNSGIEFENPKVVFYMIVELAGSTCYSAIVEQNPVPLEELKPYLFDAIRSIISGARKAEPKNPD